MTRDVRDYLHLPLAPADARVSYGERDEQFGDLYLPATAGPHPVVIVLHGGCWRAAYDLAPVSGLCRALAGEGIAAWNLEYRRLGGGGGWPGTFLDAGAGADHLRTLASGHALDLSRVIALGHSAGGHLALWLAARPRLPRSGALAAREPLALRGVVALAAIADLAEGARLGLCGDACRQIVAGDPATLAQRLAQASPRELLPLGVPHRHIVGSLDALVPPELVERFTRAAGGEARCERLEGAGHFDLVVPEGPPWQAVRGAVRELLGSA